MRKTYDTLMIVFSAFVFSTLIYLIVGFALLQTRWKAVLESRSILQILFVLFMALSMFAVVAAIKIRGTSFSQEMAVPENLEHLQRYVVSRSIVTFALSEAPAILGLVLFLLSGKFLFQVVFCVVSVVSFLLVRPSRELLDDLERRYQFGSR